MNIKRKWIHKIVKTIESCYLCIKYPFLYPRNRFSDKHYNNWKLDKKIEALRQKGSVPISIMILDDSETLESKINRMYSNSNGIKITKEISPEIKYNGHKLLVLARSLHPVLNELAIYKYTSKRGICLKTIPISKLIQSGRVTNINFVTVTKNWNSISKEYHIKKLYVVISGNQLIPHTYKSVDNYFDIFNPVLELDKFTLFKAKVLEFIHNTILQYIFFIPTYTELDAMPNGWRKAFGIQLCKELKQELKKYSYLYKYRIMQIKEKFGSLRWYSNGSPDGCEYPIIDKYECISERTCICCGAPAKYITKGWISPYCEKCVPKDSAYYKIEFEILNKKEANIESN